MIIRRPGTAGPVKANVPPRFQAPGDGRAPAAKRGILHLASFLALTLALWAPAARAQWPDDDMPQALAKPWKGDLDGMVKRRVIRVLVVPSRTSYFLDKATQRGTAYDAMKAFEQELNQKFKTGKLGLHVVFIPMGRDDLLKKLEDGSGDLIVAPIIVTPQRREQVDFTVPVWTKVDEIVVTAPGAAPVVNLEALSGRTILVNPTSVYWKRLEELNVRLQKSGKAPAKLREAPATLEDEDLLEMVNAGVAEATVTRDYLAEFWQQVFPEITVNPGAELASGDELAWAMRKNSPQLKAALDDFIKRNGQGTAFGNELFRRYLKSTKWVKNSTNPEDMKKFRQTIDFFKKYGDQYDFDWLLLAAQGYQESQLNQAARNPSGAVGIMQVLPSTGAEMEVGDITVAESNVHAGVKYLRFMMDQYFKDDPMDRVNKGLFAFASYNAGPSRIRSLRNEAAKRGLDPNVWFNNVELVASARVGQEVVQYVSNIYKYYVAYRLILDEQQSREKVKKAAGE